MKEVSDQYIEYLQLFDLGRFSEAAIKLDEAVSIRDPMALHTRAYEAEESNPPRIKQALKLYRMAAQQGYEPSIMNLARYYESQRNARWYFYWLRKAASMGSPEAEMELARPFPYLVSRAVIDIENGNRIEDAAYCFRLAARHGNIDAMINLANLYDLKFSPPRRYLAEKLYKKAASEGSEIASFNLARHYADLQYRKKYRKHSDPSSKLTKLNR